MQKKTEDFLRKTGMHYEEIDLRKSCDVFVAEMGRGLAGEKSSLMMLPTYIQLGGKVPLNQRIIVMDAGGTNFRVAAVTLREDGPLIESFQKHRMPGTQGAISRERFFETMADYMMPVVEVSEDVGFCFSFATEIQPDRDGKILYFSKELHVDDGVGSLVGAGINQALEKRGIAPKRFTLLNDTVATMLGGVADTKDEAYESHIGYILGTGTNTCYIENCDKITKSAQALNMGGRMAINMESGGYGLVTQGEVDKELDAATATPGLMVMEKMISGQYQGHLIYLTVRRAVKEGLFSTAFAGRLEGMDDFNMFQIDQFCFHPHGDNPLAGLCGENSEDARTLYEIIDASFERAAILTAVNMAAILVQTDTGADPTRPVCVTAEGTTFYKSKLFKGKLDYYVRTFVNDELGRYLEFRRAEDVTLIGSAVAGLMNR